LLKRLAELGLILDLSVSNMIGLLSWCLFKVDENRLGESGYTILII